MTESDDALRVAREEIKRQAAEIDRLKTRLEVSPDHPYDGIASRDATIKLQDERIAELREPVNARLLEMLREATSVLEWYEDANHIRTLHRPGDWVEGRKKLEDEGFRMAGENYNGSETFVENGKRAEAAAVMLRAVIDEAPQTEPDARDKAASELQADAARYRYIRTHRIGVKWCELYAGGPLLDGVIDEMLMDAGPCPIDGAALRASKASS